ncbi:hypothetical protein, partial [Klebsiella pneumoniae]
LGLGSTTNILFFNASPLQLWGALDLVMFTVSLAAFFSRSRRFYAPLTLAYLPLAMIDIAVSLGA